MITASQCPGLWCRHYHCLISATNYTRHHVEAFTPQHLASSEEETQSGGVVATRGRPPAIYTTQQGYPIRSASLDLTIAETSDLPSRSGTQATLFQISIFELQIGGVL